MTVPVLNADGEPLVPERDLCWQQAPCGCRCIRRKGHPPEDAAAPCFHSMPMPCGPTPPPPDGPLGYRAETVTCTCGEPFTIYHRGGGWRITAVCRCGQVHERTYF
ncbi:STE/STE11/SSK protein kinase [Mycolicibacterium canariasense]|uniref:STE/STE11/SSK protein kinase n=1 Tax=Mycolicibacterium canariasense TaxID=228230 RepID=A0A100WJ41_MYCCR|nr:hypothetical protein [Mycolicibacterium canariasense]MCV7208376.1 hypothetical protein [Mycolicibacterium canariasense]ORV13560.1 hypothetical protein AWB94_04885 [Mycolicibacterium canariasense]GAS98768.1 STE/STE11/SSK protein kinase [Mycolicibacterium canariasense]